MPVAAGQGGGAFLLAFIAKRAMARMDIMLNVLRRYKTLQIIGIKPVPFAGKRLVLDRREVKNSKRKQRSHSNFSQTLTAAGEFSNSYYAT